MGVVSFEIMKAREALRSAENALRRIEDVAEMEVGFEVNAAVQQRVRHAERRVDAARAALRRIDPHADARPARRFN